LCSLVILYTMGLAQEPQTILRAPEGWNSEIISFPLGFAPSIDFVGFEDIRFAPGWADPSSEQFWTYHFVWFLEKKDNMDEEILTETLTRYYDGLMQAVLTELSDTTHSDTLDKTLCLFVQTDEGFTGKIRVFDAFFTKEPITLNVKVKEYMCKETNKQAIAFDISPQGFDHKVWQGFKEIQLIVECN
ncbi:MAG: hypothetical protein AAF694_26930, partial [Bacteroidota bacterium]